MNRPVLGLLTAVHVVDDLYTGAVPALVPFLVAERHYSYTAATGVLLAGTFLSSVIQPAFGALTDRHHMTWLVGAGMLVAGVGIGLAGLPDSYALTWLAVAMSGVGVAAFHPEASRLARLAAGASAQGMSWFSLGGNAGIALAPLLVAPVLAATGLRGTPLLALPAVVAALGLLLARSRARRRAATAAAPPRAAAARRAARPDDWRSFGWLTAVVVIRSIAFFGIASFLAEFVIHRFGQSSVVGSAALSTFTGIGLVGTLLGGWLADRWGRVTAVRAGYALTLPALVGMLLAPTLLTAFAAAAVLGIASFIPFSVQVTLGQEYLPQRVGTASGVTLGLAISVGGLFSPLLGMLADARGLTATLAALLALPIAALALSLRLPEPPRRPVEVPRPG